MVAPLAPRTWLLPGLLASLAAACGVLAGADAAMAIAMALAIVLMVVTIVSLTAGLVGFIVLSFLELVPAATGPALSVAKAAGLVLAVSWLAGVASGQFKRLFPSVHPYLTFVLLAFLAWNLVSIAWAEDPEPAYVSVASYALAFALFPIVFSALRTKRHMLWMMTAFVLGAAFTAIYGVLTQPNAAALATSPAAASGLNRLEGTIGDPNELASLLVAGVALSGVIIFNRNVAAPFRLGVTFCTLLMLIAVFFTLSRGGLVALGALGLTAILASGRHRLQAALAGLAVAGVALVFFFGVASPEARDRIIKNDGGSGRTDIWKVGWRMVEAEPLLGVGAANFQTASVHYLLAPGAIRYDEYLVDIPAVSHNLYLGVLAETGVPGLTLFLLIVIACIAAAVRAQRTFRSRDDPEGELMATCLITAIGALLAAYFFLSEEHSKHLWLLLSFCPALLAIARRADEA